MTRRLPVLVAMLSAFSVFSAPAAAATPDDLPVIPAGFAISAVQVATRLLALTVVPIDQFPSFDRVVMCESGWNFWATNPASGAYWLGQALPPEKMATHRNDWRYNPMTQIRCTA